MSGSVLLTKTIKGREIEIRVTDDGTFMSLIDGDWLRADTMAEILKLAARTVKKSSVRVSVPFSRLGWVRVSPKHGRAFWGHGLGVRHGIATGKHSRSQNFLVKWEDGEAEQLSGRSDHIVRRLSDAEVDEWIRLEKTEREASHAMEDFRRRVDMSLTDALKAAQTAAVDTPVEPEPDPAEDGDPR